METAVKRKQLAAYIAVAGAALTLVVTNAITAASEPTFTEQCEITPEYNVRDVPAPDARGRILHCISGDYDGGDYRVIDSKRVYD